MSDYSKWKKLHEAESPGKTKQTAGLGQKIVGIPIDAKSFKVKIINDLDVVNSAGKLTQEGWTSILNWIKQQPKWLPFYPGLGDQKNFFVVYSVNADTDRKQLITFTIQPRTSAPGLPEATTIVKQEDLAGTIKDQQKLTVLNQDTKNAVDKKVDTTSEQQANATNILRVDDMKNLKSDAPLFTLIDDLYVHLKGDKRFSTLPIMPSLKTELKGGVLGDSAKTFVKAMIAGFGLKDKYDDPIAVVNNDLMAKMKSFLPADTPQNSSRNYFIDIDGESIFEQELIHVANLPAGFDFDQFAKVMGKKEVKPVVQTGEIAVPEGGIKQGSVQKGDENLKKAQLLLVEKLAPVLTGEAHFDKFKAAIEKAGPGFYGPLTHDVVVMAKAGFKLVETDGSTITTELINKLQTQKVTESFIGLDGHLFEQFDVEAAKKVVANKPVQSKATTGDQAKTSSGSAGVVEIDALLKEASNAIVQLFDNDDFFATFKGGNWFQNDQDSLAAEAFFTWQRKTIRKNQLARAREKVKTLPKEDQSTCLENIMAIEKACTNIINKMSGSYDSGDDIHWSIYVDGGVKSYKVNTDF